MVLINQNVLLITYNVLALKNQNNQKNIIFQDTKSKNKTNTMTKKDTE